MMASFSDSGAQSQSASAGLGCGDGGMDGVVGDNIEVGSFFGIDFGGTLTKFVCFEPDEVPDSLAPLLDFLTSNVRYGATGERDAHLSFHSRKLGGRFHFVIFETRSRT